MIFFGKNLLCYFLLLPSATKLRRLCFYRRLSVNRGGCLVPGGSGPEGGCLASGGVGVPACTEARPPPPGEPATAADGTHPTGMYSCFFIKTTTKQNIRNHWVYRAEILKELDLNYSSSSLPDPGRGAPSRCSFFHFSCNFRQKSSQIVGFCPLLTPPPHPTRKSWIRHWSSTRADLGFPVAGGANPPGGTPTYKFARFSEKLHEIQSTTSNSSLEPFTSKLHLPSI